MGKKSDKFTHHVLRRLRLIEERMRKTVKDIENVSSELKALYNYMMKHGEEGDADAIGVIEFDLNLALSQINEILRELVALEYEVEEDEQEE